METLFPPCRFGKMTVLRARLGERVGFDVSFRIWPAPGLATRSQTRAESTSVRGISSIVALAATVKSTCRRLAHDLSRMLVGSRFPGIRVPSYTDWTEAKTLGRVSSNTVHRSWRL